MKFFHYSTLQGALRIFFRKNYLKTSSTVVWTLSCMFLDTFVISYIFNFFWFFSGLDPPGCSGQNLLPKKIPRSMLKICLKTFGNVFAHFEKNERFPIFLKFFQVSTLQDALGNFLSRKNLKTKSKLLWTLLRTILDTFENSKFFRFFFEFLQVSISRLHWSRKSRKNYLKQVWTLLETFFRGFETLKIFPFYWKFSTSRTLQCALKKNFEKNTSKQVWTLLESFFGILELWNFFHFCGFFLVSRVHWAELFPSKKSVKTFSNNVFGNVFGQF